LAVLVFLYGTGSEFPIRWALSNKVFREAKMADDVQWAAGVRVEFSLYEGNSFVAI